MQSSPTSLRYQTALFVRAFHYGTGLVVIIHPVGDMTKNGSEGLGPIIQ